MSISKSLSEVQIDAFKEILNIGIGKSADVLYKVTGKKVLLELLQVMQVMSLDDLKKEISNSESPNRSSVDMSFEGEFSGTAQLVFSTSDAGKLVSLFIGEDSSELEMNDLMKSTLMEIGNIVLNSLVGTIGNIFKTQINYSMPVYSDQNEMDSNCADKMDNNIMLLAKTNFTICDVNIIGGFVFYLEISSMDRFFQLLEKSYFE